MLSGINVETDPGLENVKELNNCELTPGETPARRPCQIGFAPMEEMVEAELELLVKVPPKFPENLVWPVVAMAFGISNKMLNRLVAEPRFAIVKPLVTNELEVKLDARSQPTIHEVTGYPSPSDPA